MGQGLKICSCTRVRWSCLSSISNPLRKVATATFNATNANTMLIKSKFTDLPLESFLFLRGKYFCIFLNVIESAWRVRGTLGEQGWRIAPTNVALVRILAAMPYVGVVVGPLLCSKRFFSGYSGFSFSLKTSTSKFQFDLERTDAFQRILKNS